MSGARPWLRSESIALLVLGVEPSVTIPPSPVVSCLLA